MKIEYIVLLCQLLFHFDCKHSVYQLYLCEID